MWKGVLMLFALGAGPTDQPIQTTGWGQIYSVAQYGTSEVAHAICARDVGTKADELNKIYSAAGEYAGWVSTCVEAK